MKATWNGTIIAESGKTEIVEGNYYFPFESVNNLFLEKSNTTSICHWKGEANYYNIMVDGERNEDTAWYYAHPSKAASNIKDCVAFWKGVEVSE